MDYIQCDILNDSLPKPLPEELRYRAHSKTRIVFGVVITVVFVVILLLFGWWSTGSLARSPDPSSKQTEYTPIPRSTISIAIPNLFSDPKYTPTLIPSLVPTGIQTQTGTPAPEDTPDVTGTDTSTPFLIPTETVCTPPSGWAIYIVQPNDSLFQIGLDFNVTVADLQAVNCLGISVTIYAGQELFVPNVPTRTPLVTPTQVTTDVASPIPASTNTLLPVVTQLPTDTPIPRSTPLPSKTYTPPPFPTETFTPPPTEVPGG